MKIFLFTSAVILLTSFVNIVHAQDLPPGWGNPPAWIQGSGKSCPQVCNDNDLFPVAAGTYQNGNKFYVCAGNANGQGFIVGYNLSPTWSTSCTIGWGGKEVSEKNYYCLCYSKNIALDK